MIVHVLNKRREVIIFNLLSSVVWYTTSTVSLGKSRFWKSGFDLFDWFHRHQMEPITEDFSLREQNMIFVELYIHWTLSEKIALIGW